MKFVMMSDTHYISRRMIADETNKELMLQPAVSEQAVKQALKEADTLFIIGDITDSGDRYSHEDYAEFLRSVKTEGKKIYVLFATHDFHHHKAYVRKYGEKVVFKTDPWNKPYFDKTKVVWKDLVRDKFSDLSEEECTPGLVDALSPEEIWEIYKDFGPDEAYSVHEASFSYCIDLDDETRCLMLNDSFRNEEALKDLSPTYSPSCFRWIKQMVDEAKRDGKFIFACSHHPMLPAVPGHRIGAGKGNRDMRSPVVGHTLADIGINLAFSGHSHFCDVGYLKSGKGNLLCSITAPSVRFYPPAYRLVELNGNEGRIKYNCTYIDTPEGVEIEEESLFEHYHKNFYNEFYGKITGASPIVKKLTEKLTLKDIYFLVKNKAGLSEDEFNAIKDVKVIDYLLEIGFNMLVGDGAFTPDTPEYKIMISLCTMLDSIIDTQPFADIKGNILHGYSLRETIEPMLFNNYTPDKEADIDFTIAPEKKINTPEYSSNAGAFVMALVYGLAILISFKAPLITAVGIPALVVRKKLKEKKNPTKPFYKYY